MQVPIRGMYTPPHFGYAPLRMRRPALGVVRAAAFPAPTPEAGGDINLLQGYVQKPLTDSIFLGVGGAGVAYASRFLPGVGEPIALVGGLGLLGLGVYKFYRLVSGDAEPNVVTVRKPQDQKAEDVQNLTGKILQPANGGAAELSSMWTAVFQSQRTFKIKFAVINNSPKPLTALLELRTEQTSRPLFGEPDTYQFSTDYLVENIAPGETKIVNGWQPIEPVASLRSQDVVAKLMVRDNPREAGTVVDSVKFTAW